MVTADKKCDDVVVVKPFNRPPPVQRIQSVLDSHLTFTILIIPKSRSLDFESLKCYGPQTPTGLKLYVSYKLALQFFFQFQCPSNLTV